MFCKNCGKEIKNTNFCSYCGTKVEKVFKDIEDIPVVETEEKNTKNVKKLLLVVIAIVIVAVVAVGGWILAGNGGEKKSDKFIALLESGKTEEAMTYYEETLCQDEKELESAKNKIIKKLEAVLYDYNDEKISYEEAVEEIKCYDELYQADVNSVMKKINNLQLSKEFFETGEENFKNGKYEEAYEMYAQVDDSDKNYSNATDKKSQCYKKMVDAIFQTCEDYASKNEYKKAIAMLEAKLSFFNTDDKAIAEEKIDTYTEGYLTNITNDINTYLNNGKYEESFKLIETTEQEIGKKTKLDELKATVIKKYEEYVKSSIENYKTAELCSDGVIFLNKAEQLIPNSEVIMTLRDELKKYIPIELEKIAMIDTDFKGSMQTHKSVSDLWQNTYESVLSYRMSSNAKLDSNYQVYLLNGNYEYFTTLVTPAENWDSDRNVTIAFYGDDIKLAQVSITRKSQPIKVEFDVTGVQQLKICFEVEKSSLYHAVYFLVAEPFLYEKY